ncbi:MAG: DNA-processing protein DprA [Oscillospiraceae bacterium]
MSALKYWVWLSSLYDLRPKTRSELISAFGDPESVYFADNRQLLEKVKLTDFELQLISDKSLQRSNEILERCGEEGVSLLTLRDSAYPQRLLNIFDPPILLYIKGRLPIMDEQAAIGIVGTRKASPYGIKMSRRMGFEITKGGGLVVTGLALGIDSASAEGALRAGGSCVGVLGCAIDDIYPHFNDIIYNDVAAVGALVSEYPPGTPLMPKSFPERNRIISGLSVGVVVIEAPVRSGALITASRALDQGREVFAVPGNADAANCFGSNGLIRDGAQLVSCGWEVLEDFEQRFPEKLKKPDKKAVAIPQENEQSFVKASVEKLPSTGSKHPAETGKGFLKLRVATERKKIDKEKKREYIDLKEQLGSLSETQLKIISVMDNASKHVDDLIDLSGLDPARVLSDLTILQIKGFVSQESGKRFTLNIRKN